MTHASAFRRGAFAVLFAGVALHAALNRGGAVTAADWVGGGVHACALALLAWRAASKREQRLAWSLLTLATAFWAVGDMLLATPSAAVAETLYFGAYATGYPALLLLVRGNMARPVRVWLALDGILVGLTVGAFLAGSVYRSTGASEAAAPLLALGCDVLLLTTVMFAFAMSGWRPGRMWWALGTSEVLLAVIDARQAVGTYVHGGMVDSLVLFAFVLCCSSAWCPPGRKHRPPTGWAAPAVPITGAALAIGVLVHAGLARDGTLTVCLAAAAMLVGIGRAALLFHDNLRLLRHARKEATTDKLTGLPNRRALVGDLEVAGKAGHHTLAFFDLDGFKEYNDAFGHQAGDALLQRLAPALAAGGGRGYRLGGDEFCLLVEGALDDEHPRIRRAVDALTERGDGFDIGASFGLVVLPDDARDTAEALRLADERMYARKRRRRAGHRGQARDVLVQLMAERDAHGGRVALLAAAAGRRLGLAAEDLDVLVRAAELHDIGKVAVPDEILWKPGPLDAAEWAVVRQHTIAGERILGVVESMRPVARIVRAAHERWDGEGYPDGLAGEAIPLGARIVCACDAYEAMVSRRPYREAMSSTDALAELRRCAGGQFDPRVAEVVAEVAANLDTVVSG